MEENVGKIWRITGDSPNFTLQINDVQYKESKQARICKSFIYQKFQMGSLLKFSFTKHSRYTYGICAILYTSNHFVIMSVQDRSA